MSDNQELELLMTRLDSKEELQQWILGHLYFELPDQKVSRFANSSPLDFAWICYEAMLLKKPLTILSLSGRDSGKTLALSVIDMLAITHFKRDVLHVAMSRDQGNRAKYYIQQFNGKNPVLQNAVITENSKTLKYNIDGEEVGIEIIPANPKAVQGAHGSVLSFDELASSMQPENVRAIKDASGIVGSSKDGAPAIVIKITSRQAGHSLAEQDVKNGKIKVISWTIFENTERCPDERSGIIPTPLYINNSKGEVLLPEEFEKIAHENKAGFEYIDSTFDKCRNCPIASLCFGDAKKQECTSVTLRKIDDVIVKHEAGGSQDWSNAQLMSLKPSTEGVIYWEYDRKKHVPGWNVMWERLTGQKTESPINRNMFIQELKRRGALFYGGIDWGFNPSPSIAIVMAVDKRGFMYVVEAVARIKLNDPAFINDIIVNDLQPEYDVQMWCPDLANASGRDILKQSGVPTTDDIDKRIMLGVNLVKSCLRPPGMNGETRIMLAPDLDKNMPKTPNGEISSIYDEFDLYHKNVDAAGRVKDMLDPADEYDHFMDALRYLIYWLIGRQRATLSFGETDFTNPLSTPGQKTDTQTNVPTNKDLLRQQGIHFMEGEGTDEETSTTEATGAVWRWT